MPTLSCRTRLYLHSLLREAHRFGKGLRHPTWVLRAYALVVERSPPLSLLIIAKGEGASLLIVQSLFVFKAYRVGTFVLVGGG